jgi:hypothetical protein
MDWLETLAVAVATGSLVIIVCEIALRQPSAFIELGESERFARSGGEARVVAAPRRRPLRYAPVAGGLAAAALAIVVAQFR